MKYYSIIKIRNVKTPALSYFNYYLESRYGRQHVYPFMKTFIIVIVSPDYC